jgi:hypothetical protein
MCSRACFICFKALFQLLFNMIKHVWLGCLMMHNMHDLQCLNACVTPGCYSRFTGLRAMVGVGVGAFNRSGRPPCWDPRRGFHPVVVIVPIASTLRRCCLVRAARGWSLTRLRWLLSPWSPWGQYGVLAPVRAGSLGKARPLSISSGGRDEERSYALVPRLVWLLPGLDHLAFVCCCVASMRPTI